MIFFLECRVFTLIPSGIHVYLFYKKLHQIKVTRRGPLLGLGELVTTFVQVPLSKTLHSAAPSQPLSGQQLKTAAVLSCSQA